MIVAHWTRCNLISVYVHLTLVSFLSASVCSVAVLTHGRTLCVLVFWRHLGERAGLTATRSC